MGATSLSGAADRRTVPLAAPQVLPWVVVVLLFFGTAGAQSLATGALPAARGSSLVTPGKYHLRLRDRCPGEGWLACVACRSAQTGTQLLVDAAGSGGPQAWQLDVAGTGSPPTFTLRPLDARCCSSFVASEPAGCGAAYAWLYASRSMHPAEIYWGVEPAQGGGLRLFLEARQGCGRKYLGAAAACSAGQNRVLQVLSSSDAVAAVVWDLLPLGSLRPPPPPQPRPRPKPRPPPAANPKPKPPPPKPKPKPRPPPPKPKPKPRPPPPKPKPRPRPPPPKPKPRPRPPPPKPKPRPRPPPPKPKPPAPRPPKQQPPPQQPKPKPPPPPRGKPTWTSLPSPVGADAANASSLPAFSFTVCPGTGEQYAAYTVLYSRTSHRTAVKRLSGGRWVDSGRAGFTAARGSRMGLACYADGDPLLALSDAAARFAGSAYRLPAPGGAWAGLGPPGFFSALWDVAAAVDAQGRALVAFANPAKQYRAAVMRYGGVGWAFAGAGGDALSAAFADSLQLAVGPAGGPPGVAGVPFLSFMDFGTNSAAVRKLSGAGWARVGGGTPMTNGQLPRIAFSPNGTLFIAHLVHPSVPVRLLTVRRYDPAADAWPRLGAADPAPGAFVTALDLAVDAAGVPCVAFNDGNAAYKVSLQCYRASAAAWAYQGPRAFSKYGAAYVTLAFDPATNTPVVAYYAGVTMSVQLPQVTRLDGYSSPL